MEQTVSADFELVNPDGKKDEKATAALLEVTPLRDIIASIIESEWYGYSVVELSADKAGRKSSVIIPRRNLIPQTGMFLPDANDTKGIAYRELREFDKWILEFNSGHAGLLNKCVSHLLFKRFAQSCWSELCEIYGIPPRYIKTNTQDPEMLNRAERMMRDLGAAAWFIIDSTEEFEFAQGVNTNGDVYSNLISLCNNEISMIVSGAIIGQDTENGNYSKEKAGLEVLSRLVDSDKRMVEAYMNSTVIPALYRIGWIPATTSLFHYTAAEDTDKLWEMVAAILPHKEVNNEWINEKFGIPVTDKAAPAMDGLSALKSPFDFFA